ncbi:MAG: 50S ribosomal protein L37ae [Candidatus Bathyarchaeia archaeon]
MGRTYKVGPSGSFGARYGTVARKRYSTIITGLRAAHECPQCHISAVKRLSVGIWVCGRCGFKFAGGAYAPRTKLGEIAERASRAGVASTMLAEIKAQKARQTEAETKPKVPRKRRRAVSKIAAPTPVELPPVNDASSEDKPT